MNQKYPCFWIYSKLVSIPGSPQLVRLSSHVAPPSAARLPQLPLDKADGDAEGQGVGCKWEATKSAPWDPLLPLSDPDFRSLVLSLASLSSSLLHRGPFPSRGMWWATQPYFSTFTTLLLSPCKAGSTTTETLMFSSPGGRGKEYSKLSAPENKKFIRERSPHVW